MDFERELDQTLSPDLPNRSDVVAIASRHLALVQSANEQMNLTRVTECREAVIKHVVDSLAPWSLFEKASLVMDAGTGAGFPGIPLAAALPHVQFLLVDSTQKKARFVESAVGALGLKNVEVLSERAEDLLKQNRCSVITARAVAPIDRALTYFANNLRGGEILLYKGPDVETEMREAEWEAKRRRVRMEIALRYELPDGLGSRTIVRIVAQ